MNIGVICHQNLARSQLLVSFLQKNYSDHKFFSAGISDSAGLPFPSNVLTLSDSWNLPLIEDPNRDLQSVSNLVSNSDVLICADNSVHDFCAQNILGKRLINLSSLSEEFDMTIVDPYNLELNEFKTVIAKYLFLGNQVMRDLDGIQKKLISLAPEDIDDIDDKFRQAIDLATKSDQAIIFDYSLKVPNVRFIQESDFEISTLNETFIENLVPSCSVINTFGKEFVNWESTYLDLAWRQRFRTLSERFQVILVLPPRKVNGVEIPDSYLSFLTT